MPADDLSRASRRRDEIELEAALRSVERARRAQGLDGPARAVRAAPTRRRTSWWRVAAWAVAATVGWLWVGGPDEGPADASRYSRPPEFTPGEGSYAFLNTQPGGTEPVGFNPCYPIEYVVNPAGAPPDWRELILDGVAHVEWASGLDLRDLGTTTARPFNPSQIDGALGQRPVVIGFADQSEIPRLAGDVVGLGSGVRDVDAFGRTYYKGGSVALDTDFFDGPSSGMQRARLQATVDHELAHVVGLDHVDDPGELMDEGDGARTDFGPGDLEGLSMLGAVPCS